MNQSMQRAIQHLFQVSSLEAVTREQLETFVEEYPCFGFGHYLLSHKLRVENADQFLSATQKTSLYFSNPFWLQWMLDNMSEPAKTWSEPGTPVEESKSLRESLQKINEDIQSDNGQVEVQMIAQPVIGDEPVQTVVEPAQIAEEPVQVPDEPVQLAGEEPAPATEAPIQDEEPPFVLDETDPTTETAPVAEVAPIAETAHAEHAMPMTETAPVEPTALIQETAPMTETAPVEPTAPPIHTPTIAENAPLFEPLHTIDYFASQGIRLTLDENPTDQLGRQLKSFTDWLRTMRRLPQKDREIIPDRVAEQTVQNFAAHSIEGKEPVTETMAEVLVKQGMPDRARIVYEKLSLLNPDKSAYFAAKIEQLNSH